MDAPEPRRDPASRADRAGAVRAPASRLTRLRRRASQLGRKLERYPTLLFVATLALVDSVLNVRYPSGEAPLWYLVPSLDVIVLLALLALCAQLRWRIPTAVRVATVVALVSLRLLRLADGVQQHYFAEKFNLYSDLVLIPELFRFVHSALPWWAFVLGLLGAALGMAAMSFGLYFGLAHVERYFRKLRHVYIGAAVVGGLWVVSSFVGHAPIYDEYFDGALAASVVPRLQHEADFLYNMYSDEGQHARKMASAEARIRKLPTNLSKLGGRNVHLILVESYGDAVFSWPRYAEPTRAAFDRFQSELEADGFSIVTGALDSPTYGGRSWLAHSTIATGIKVTGQLDYELVCTRRPKVLARFFRDAGYRTVLVQPGTTRAWPKGEVYDFEKKYYAWDFDYAGPAYAWATMPDQYVLDFIQRREYAPGPRPLFIQYVLVSSHAPWSDLPPLLADWSSIGNGAIYHRVKGRHFPIEWPHFENAQEAYIESILYDFEVLKQHLRRSIRDDSLIIVLGDHQPVSDLTGNSPSWGVPVHVFSRDPQLLEPFKARGYIAGMRPPRVSGRAGLETFLGDFVSDFSTWDVPGKVE